MERLTKGGGSRKAPSPSMLKGNPFFSSPEDSCDSLSFITEIHPHEPGVLSLKVKNVVAVSLGAGNRVEIYNTLGELCGYLTSKGAVSRLIACMKNGNKYKGTISTILNGRYDIEISPIK